MNAGAPGGEPQPRLPVASPISAPAVGEGVVARCAY